MDNDRKTKRTLGIGKGNMATVDDFTAPVYEVSSNDFFAITSKICIKRKYVTL